MSRTLTYIAAAVTISLMAIHLAGIQKSLHAWDVDRRARVGRFDHDNPNGRLLALANHNNDLAEYWEWSDRGFFGIDPTNQAYMIGVNYVIYSLTH